MESLGFTRNFPWGALGGAFTAYYFQPSTPGAVFAGLTSGVVTWLTCDTTEKDSTLGRAAKVAAGAFVGMIPIGAEMLLPEQMVGISAGLPLVGLFAFSSNGDRVLFLTFTGISYATTYVAWSILGRH